jgi:hypothetical protein
MARIKCHVPAPSYFWGERTATKLENHPKILLSLGEGTDGNAPDIETKTTIGGPTSENANVEPSLTRNQGIS